MGRRRASARVAASVRARESHEQPVTQPAAVQHSFGAWSGRSGTGEVFSSRLGDLDLKVDTGSHCAPSSMITARDKYTPTPSESASSGSGGGGRRRGDSRWRRVRQGSRLLRQIGQRDGLRCTVAVRGVARDAERVGRAGRGGRRLRGGGAVRGLLRGNALVEAVSSERIRPNNEGGCREGTRTHSMYALLRRTSASVAASTSSSEQNNHLRSLALPCRFERTYDA